MARVHRAAVEAVVVTATAAAAALLLATGCSVPTNVTGTAGEPSVSVSSAVGGQPSVPGSPLSQDLLAVLPQCASIEPQPGVSSGLPETTLACLGAGGPVALSGLRGPLIINTWASWCAPCRSELPALASFAESTQEVSVLGLNVSDDQSAAADLWAQLLMPFPSVIDPQGDTRADLGWIGLPVTYFVDAEGVIVARHDGAVTDPAQWREMAEQHLGVP